MLAFQSTSWQPASTIAAAAAIATTKTNIKKQQLSNKQIKEYVVILTIILLQYLCCRNSSRKILNQSYTANNFTSRPKMGDRLNIGREVRELKLGSTFNPQNSQTAFHTIKYDFKPASVDLNRVATVDVGSNNQVTVTVPNLESSGVPHTVFKGNQRKYTKECLLIFDRKTGTVTLERLNHNIQVKKTRSETQAKAPVIPPTTHKYENNTQRTQSKTKVSTGSRKNNIIGFVPRNSPMQPQQGSPSSYSSTHKSPQSAPVKCNSSRWNANHTQPTLPSIPLIEVDDDIGMTGAIGGNNISIGGSSNHVPHHHQQQQQQHHHQQQHPPPPMMSANSSLGSISDFHHPQTQYHNQNNNNNSSSISGSSIPHMNSNSIGSNGPNLGQSSSTIASSSLASAAAHLEREIGVLSSSDSTSDSDSSGSGSDSDDSADDTQQQQQQHKQNNQQSTNQFQNYANGSFPALLHDDLQLSESCSDSDDD